MKKKLLQQTLTLRKQHIAAITELQIIGGNTAGCEPPTIYNICGTNTCQSADCGTGGTTQTCLTDAAASCTPRGCGNSLFNC